LIEPKKVPGTFLAPFSTPLIPTTIEEQLRFEPQTTTPNWKPLERPIEPGARWELVQFDAEAGLAELRAVWSTLWKEIRSVECP
jgi:hypothetical protein